MSVSHANYQKLNLPPEERLLKEVYVRLITPGERQRHDQLMDQEHYLGNSNSIGAVLRYVAEYRGEWVAALTFCSASLHIKARDRLLKWSGRQVRQRRHLLVQNSRFLILPSTGHWPNLASRVLKLVCQRLPQDWQEHFGHPVLLAESFVDPQRFRGTCYGAAGWQALGQTRGYQRYGQDYYLDTQHPKELWVRALEPGALEKLQQPELPPTLQLPARPLPPPAPIGTEAMGSLCQFVRKRLRDHRSPRGLRYPLAALVSMATLAVAAGCQGTHAIAEFAQSLNHGQRRRLGCRPKRGAPRQYEAPCERTFIRLFKALDPEELQRLFSDWMATLDDQQDQQDKQDFQVIHLDGKTLRNARPADPRLQEDPNLREAAATVDTPADHQKPKAEKALTLVNFQTPQQRLVDQIVVPSDTNEEAAVAAHLPQMDLCGMLTVADAAHTTKANCRHLTQEQGGDYLFFLKGNQPNAFNKAKQLLGSVFFPSGLFRRQGPRTH